MRRILKIVISVVVVLLVLAIILVDVLRVWTVSVPPREPVQVTVAAQGWQTGWRVGEADWFHHASQGTRILPYSWFKALEQPDFTVFATPKKFSDPKYLERFGFLPSVRDEKQNPDGLPIGFAIERSFQEPFSEPSAGNDLSPPKYLKAPYEVVGLTCAACHTGQINFQGRGIRIDGAPAMVNLGLFQKAVGQALGLTDLIPWRFQRFAKEVLGNNYANSDTVDELKAELHARVATGKSDNAYARLKHLYDLDGGPGRTDALSLIANRAFKDFNDQDNLAVADAPVSFPPLWYAPWYDWVQYNASIRLPMVRNIGEVLGVGGVVNVDPKRGRLWLSTANVENLHWMEEQIAGKAPFAGLQSPKWPKEMLGDFDAVRLKRGKELYDKFCLSCHVTVEQLVEAQKSSPPNDAFWHLPDPQIAKSHPGQGAFVRLRQTNIGHIGTDPAQAVNLNTRLVRTGSGEYKSADEVLELVTGRIRDDKYKSLGLSKDAELGYDGYRRELLENPKEDDDKKVLFARLNYKAIPLSGVWCTAPYLHNGSVPTLYDLLSPTLNRPPRFHVGSREFNKERVGITTDRSSSGFEFDTTLPGNLNCGHEFRNLTLAEFERHTAFRFSKDQSEQDRWAIVLEVSKKELQGLRPEQKWDRTRIATDKALGAGLKIKGVLGGEFSEEERMALIEYLKSL